MKWNEFNSATINLETSGPVRTDIECPICGKKVLWDSRVTLTSLPPKYHYWCPCGWSGDSYIKWRKE